MQANAREFENKREKILLTHKQLNILKLENIYNSSGRPPYGSYLPAQWHTVIQKAVAMSGTASLALRLR
ncbi:uncharacterized protein MICPUCDRAFT_64662 [Micromonas pusilla CCMP1545]|uniref:Predicted protein n=1 Tax=Micromonas pusilla (strain CCMP1545) TaxID=564608 RepID=C1MKW2_MICPC|nr:uncharacterized protein MICPUCDRAFT_64662 [Micromonas pusilla CCMP1545]EEH59441.1 predicted protein [Micromonas pusilla CCMP1545]|eukprot:XP_003056065.1 predicted protein [Micromonas pusilla CCMP1545]